MRDDPRGRGHGDEGRDPVLAPLFEHYHVPPAAPPLDALWARMEADVAAAVVFRRCPRIGQDGCANVSRRKTR
jgi:hypothetical protein